jgi:hypothetical protein
MLLISVSAMIGHSLAHGDEVAIAHRSLGLIDGVFNDLEVVDFMATPIGDRLDMV